MIQSHIVTHYDKGKLKLIFLESWYLYQTDHFGSYFEVIFNVVRYEIVKAYVVHSVSQDWTQRWMFCVHGIWINEGSLINEQGDNVEINEQCFIFIDKWISRISITQD